MSDPYEREEDSIYRAFERGDITREMLNQELRDLRRAYREDAEESAREAYEREIDRW